MGELGTLRYWVSLDCGQAHDYSAALVSERPPGLDELHVTSLDRAPLRTPYPTIAKAVVSKCLELEPVGAFGERRPVGLILDAGGVGRAVADLVRAEIRKLGKRGPKIRFWPVTATGGGRTTIGPGGINVPKRDLITAAVVSMQGGRLKIGDVPNAELLKTELQQYRSKLTRSGHESFEAGGRNDDLVYALALACWAWSKTANPANVSTHGRGRRPGATGQRTTGDRTPIDRFSGGVGFGHQR